MPVSVPVTMKPVMRPPSFQRKLESLCLWRGREEGGFQLSLE
jgi:hypothetical protein